MKSQDLKKSQIENFCKKHRIQPSNHPYIYVLRLKNGCYYVGYTNRFQERMEEHLVNKKRVQWTNAHHPIEILKVLDIYNTAISDPLKYETAETIRFINDYGVDKVRGGDFAMLDIREVVRLLARHGFVIIDKQVQPRKHPAGIYLNCMKELIGRTVFKI